MADASFDFLSMGYALRHVSDLAVAFAEYRRCCGPADACCCWRSAARMAGTPTAAARFYLARVVPALSRWLGGGRRASRMMRYYWDTIDACVPPGVITAGLEAAGFAQVQCDVQLGIFRAYMAQRPGGPG